MPCTRRLTRRQYRQGSTRIRTVEAMFWCALISAAVSLLISSSQEKLVKDANLIANQANDIAKEALDSSRQTSERQFALESANLVLLRYIQECPHRLVATVQNQGRRDAAIMDFTYLDDAPVLSTSVLEDGLRVTDNTADATRIQVGKTDLRDGETILRRPIVISAGEILNIELVLPAAGLGTNVYATVPGPRLVYLGSVCGG